MDDRVSTYPGRVTLTPVARLENTFDMVMADEPTQEGTPPTKANLLSDFAALAIKEAVESESSPNTPNEALLQIAGKIGLNGVRIESGSYVGTGTYGSTNPTSIILPFVPKLVIVEKFSGMFFCFWGSEQGVCILPAGTLAYMNFTYDAENPTKLQWYKDTAQRQFNAAGVEYGYTLMG